jgi:hypothetical protein
MSCLQGSKCLLLLLLLGRCLCMLPLQGSGGSGLHGTQEMTRVLLLLAAELMKDASQLQCSSRLVTRLPGLLVQSSSSQSVGGVQLLLLVKSCQQSRGGWQLGCRDKGY